MKVKIFDHDWNVGLSKLEEDINQFLAHAPSECSQARADSDGCHSNWRYRPDAGRLRRVRLI